MTRSDYQSVYAAFCAAVEATPDKPFLYIDETVAETYGIAAGETSYRAALDETNTVREAYALAGYAHRPADPLRVGLMVDNRPAFFYHWFALNALGVSVVPINAEFTASEQAYLLQHSECCLLVASDCHLDKAQRANHELAAAIPIVSETSRKFPAVTRSAASAATRTSVDDECAVLFTSGSTGTPKACLLSNEYFLDMGYWYRDIGGLCTLNFAEERLITPLPLTHMNAMATSAMAMVITSGCLIQLDRFHPKTWWSSVRDSGATICHYLGVMPAMLLQLKAQANDQESALKFGFGAGVNPSHHAKFEARFGFPLIEAWAMTETGSGGCIIANHEPRHVGISCFGKPDPSHVDYRIVGESGELAEQGELQVRRAGDNPRKGFFTEYYKNPQATAEGWAGGWWHTGDVVRRNPDGSLSFVDRSKNIIRRSGENIAALEVEAVLSRHDAPRIVAVTPVPDEIRGEEVMACIILNDRHEPNEQTALGLFEHSERELAYYKTPGYVAFVESMPLTATQKPKRNEIKLLARELLETRDDVAVFDLRSRKKKSKQG
ncbi:MAG: AMP-binding protein [Gammaproteobacteria bacterium]